MKKTKVLRPASSPSKPAESQPKPSAVQRPAEESESPSLDDADFNEVAGRYVQNFNEAAELEEQLATIKKRMKSLEEWLLEQMAIHKTDNISIAGRTLYRAKNLIVSKGTGVATESLLEELKAAGWSELIKTGYNGNTLKAAVRECRDNAEAAERTGVQFYCSASGRYFDGDAVEAGAFGSPAVCPDTGEPIVSVIDGVPANVAAKLYIEEQYKLGSRKKN